MRKYVLLFVILLFSQCDFSGGSSLDLKDFPSGEIYTNSIKISVSGINISAYKYKLDNGSWSGDRSLNEFIVEDNLSAGAHTLSVLGKKMNGQWQDQKDMKVIQWTVRILPLSQLAGLPDSLSNRQELNVFVEGNVVIYKYKLDDEEFSEERSVSLPINRENLPEGSHTLTILGKDEKGTWQEDPFVYTWTIDVTPPDVDFLNLPYYTTSSDWMDIIVNSPDAVTFRYKLDDQPYSNEMDLLTHIAESGLTQGSHSVSVIAVDEAGNWNPEDEAAVYSWTVDPNAPTAELRNLPEAYSNLTDINVTVEGTGIAAYKYKLNYGDWSEEFSVANTIQISNLEEGKQTLSVLGKESGGQWESERVYSWVIDTTAPIVNIGGDIPWTNNETTAAASVSDLNGCSYLWEKVGGSGSVSFSSSTSLSTGITGLPGEEGSFEIRFTAVDGAGNSSSDTLLFNWDNKAPVIDAGTDTGWTTKEYLLAPSITEGSPYVCLWEKTSGNGMVTFNNETQSNTTVQGASGYEASYTLRFTVTDSAGNVSSDSMIFNWDKKAPAGISGIDSRVFSFEARMNWVNPGDSDYLGTLILRSEESSFTQPSDGSSYSLGNSLGSAVVVESLDTDNFVDTLLDPETEYFYQIFVYDRAYNYSEVELLNIITAPPITYVSASLGNDLNLGFTPDTPKQTVQAGINAIFDMGLTGSVRVAAGLYEENIYLKNGISLYGAYNSDWSDRNPLRRETTEYKSQLSSPNQVSAVEGNDIDNTTVFEGFVIQMGSDDMPAMFNNNSSPIVSYNTFLGGYGIFNVFNSSPEIKNNIILSGENSLTYGVSNTYSSSPVIVNNVIYGGTATDNSYGIYCKDNSVPIVRNNTIDAGNALNTAYGFYIHDSPGMIIENNIICSSGGFFSYGFHEFWEDEPASLRNNDIFDFKVLYHGDDGLNITDINQLNRIAAGGFKGNISFDPMFVDRAAGDYHLSIDSGVDVRGGGLDLSQYFSLDQEGNARTVYYSGQGFNSTSVDDAGGWSIGAFEYDN